MPRSGQRGARWVLAVAAIGITGCSTSSRQAMESMNGGNSLGRAIATVATARAMQVPAARPAKSPEAIHPPPPPSPTAPGPRAILLVATQFARAYLTYEIGRHPRSVEQTIRATCMPAFARLLLLQPARVPNGGRQGSVYEPATLVRIAYTGPASLGPGPPVQIVSATYHTIAHHTVGGQLTIHLTGSGERWRVTGLG